MKDHNKQQETLLVRYLIGELDRKEEPVFAQWLEESEDHRGLLHDSEKAWKALAELEKMKAIDERRAFGKVSRKLFEKKSYGFIQLLQRVAAVLFIPLLIAFTIYFVVQERKTERYSSVYQEAVCPAGMRSSLVLPDGTRVWLNSGSSIRYPLHPGKERSVDVTGEVFLDIKKDPEHPFILNAGAIEIEVTGTSFNCLAYPGDDEINTVLVEGSVKIRDRDKNEPIRMEPGEMVSFSKASGKMVRTKTDPEKHIAWKSGKLVFRDDPMDVVIEKLERWYNIDIRIVDREILDYAYTATFENETLEQVLRFLELSAPISYFIDRPESQPDGTRGRQIVKLYNKNK
ncbi:MAG: FecR domain-containing protein [Prolixibacteraceae bacterium]